MNEAKYVLKTTEEITVDANPSQAKLRKVGLVVFGILIGVSLLIGDNLFSELSFMPKVILIGLGCGLLFGGKKEDKEFPLELHFYDDRVEIFRHKVYYGVNNVKREFYVFRYEHFPFCVYSPASRFTKIKGMVRGEWYRYTKEGNVPEKPERVREMEGLCYFRVGKSAGIYLPDIIKEHSPIKVVLEK